jgi:uncharacterized protein YPO0396
MQLTVFSTDNNKSGFRLQYMEVLNWGTFDEHIWKIEPGGETSLLTGANGSGKTTFVDALLTLIVPERKYRFYNQSSGSDKKGDRTEDSYVLGAYGTVPAESGSGLKTVYLRENKETAYSILLASFTNEAEQTVTLFQVRYFSGGELKKYYAIAHKPLHIETDFAPFDFSGGWRRRLEQQNKGGKKQIEWLDGAGRYAQRMVEVLGMQSIQALSLFNQTVGIKVLGDLNEFIRTNMLEPRNMEEGFQELKKHLATLLEARSNIEKVEEQIRLLQPLQQHYLLYRDAEEALKTSRQEGDTTTIWYSYTKYNLLNDAIAASRKALQEIEGKLESAKKDMALLQEEERQAQNGIEHNKAGQRLHQLEKDLEALKGAVRAAETALAQYTGWCLTLHLEEASPADEAAYSRIKREAQRANRLTANEVRENNEDLWDAQDRLKKTRAEKVQIESELNILLQSRNNIPGHLVNLRRDICQALKLETDELPFAGELIQVRSEEAEWQPALEKLLHGFSLRLLVPDKHYKKVNRYVNSTNLRGRLVYYHVHETVMQEWPEEGTVYHKLDFHPDHKLSPWVESQIIRQFDYSCVEDEKELERYDRAITINGLVKTRDRHEKDDRPERNDPGRYVMGWNNEKKQELLQKKRAQVASQEADAKEAQERAERKAKRLQDKLYAAARLSEHEDFKAIDIASLQRSIHKTEEQIASLKDSSDQLKTLTSQLEEIRRSLQTKDAERDGLIRRSSETETLLRQSEEAQGALQPIIQALVESDKDLLLQFHQRRSSELGEITLESLETAYRNLKEEAERAIKQYSEQVAAEGREVDRGITKLKSPPLDILQRFTDWAADVQGLPSEREYANEYIDWLEKLQGENLPKYRKDFERLLHDTAVIKMTLLNEELENWERKIKGSIATLNQSLGGINFNRLPDTFIQLGIKPVADTAIKEFQARLLAALPQAADWQQSSFEEKAAHFGQYIQPLVASLDQSESYRARVLDVRNWFEFWADEKFRNTGELKKSYRQMGQLSGGEKAQLTYTILCSAIAYQFGIAKEGHNSKSLRFIAVDESFSNQDEEKATYLMELCRQLHLQLLVVTPADKIQVVEDFIAHVHLVQRVANRQSVLYNMTKKELKKQKEEVVPV